MIFFLGANSRFYAIQAQSRKLREKLQRSFLAIKGLSLNYFAKNQKKTVQNILHNNPQLAFRYDIVLWHELIKNSISKHISNNFQGLTALQLNRLLNIFTERAQTIFSPFYRSLPLNYFNSKPYCFSKNA